MKKLIIILSLSFISLPVFAQDLPKDIPECPPASSLPPMTSALDLHQYGWGVSSEKVSDIFNSVVMQLHERHIQTKNQAIALANQIERASDRVVEIKNDYWTPPYGYFISCYYGIDPRSVFLGDDMTVLSVDFDENGHVSKTNHSLKEKLAILGETSPNKIEKGI